MEDDEVSGVPMNMPMGQAPQGIFQRPPVKKKKKLTKKQQTQREKKIKHNLDIRLGILPPNTPPKKLTEEEHIEFQQRLVNIKNINISRSTAKSGLGPTFFSQPPMEIPPQYPQMPPNMPIPISAPVSAGYAIGGSGQIIPVPMVRPSQGLIGASEGLLRIMDRADRKSADKPINTPQGQVPKGQATEGQQAMVGDDVERGAGINWLQQGQQSQRGQPIFPDDKYIGPTPMRSKYERDKEREEQEKILRQEREKREQKRNMTGSAYDPTGTIPSSITRFNPGKEGGMSAQEGKMRNEINVLTEELRMGKVSGAEAENKSRRISQLEEDIKADREKWRNIRAERAEKKRSRSVGGDTRFRPTQETQQGVPTQMNKNPLVIDVEDEVVNPPTSSRDMGRIDKPSEPSYAPPPGMRFNMGGELERMPSIEEVFEGLSPQEKADAAWDIATGKTPIATPDVSPKAVEEEENDSLLLTPPTSPKPAPPPAVPETKAEGFNPAGLGDMRERLKEKFFPQRGRSVSREPSEAEKAREYFRTNHHKAGGENLFDGRQGGVNRDLTYYYKNRVGVKEDEELQKWEDYKRSGYKEGTTRGKGHERYYRNEEKYKAKRAEEPGLTRQIYEYRRALARERGKAPKLKKSAE